MNTVGFNENIIVPAECHGLRADVALAKLFPAYSRAQLTQWLKEGFIKLDACQMKPKEKVAMGQWVEAQVDFDSMPNDYYHDAPEDIPLDVVFEDDILLVLNKPAGLVVHPGAGNPNHTLVNALLHHCPKLQQMPRAGIIHRLDKDTTGLLLVGKTLTAYNQLVKMMQAREIHRTYLALVYGHVVAGGRLETAYGRHPRNRLKKAVTEEGRVAITDYRIEKSYHDFTLLKVTLFTGRTHQIRVHMAHIKHPVLGDPLYGHPRLRIPAGASPILQETLKQLKRQALHACRLSFSHPVTSETITIEAPLPKDLIDLLSLMDAHYYAPSQS
jgi:23S rRNA pseudouridine1911/1915/1917 synthase